MDATGIVMVGYSAGTPLEKIFGTDPMFVAYQSLMLRATRRSSSIAIRLTNPDNYPQ